MVRLDSLYSFWPTLNIPSRLSKDEKAYIQSRLEKDQGKAALDRRITWRDIVNVFKDFKIFVGSLMYLGLIVPAYSYAFFAPGKQHLFDTADLTLSPVHRANAVTSAPGIIQGYGYSPIQTQLHSVPPWAASFTMALIVAYFSDLVKHRFVFTVSMIAISIAGFGILITNHKNTHLEYGALFLVTMGTYSAMPIIVCWFNMNLGGHHRRAVGTAWQIGFGNCGGIIATYAFLMKDAPTYKPGYSICISFCCLSLASCIIYAVACVWQNRSRDRQSRNLGLGESEKIAMGDMNPDYRYML